MKAADFIANFLADHRIRHIFAVSGAGNVHLLDAIARHPKLTYICPHHEQAGVMAAVAYSRLSANLGMMLTTGGPGASNAITGVLNAWADSIPCLVISGQEKSVHTNPLSPLRMWGVQGFDIVRAVSGITKYATLVNDPKTLQYHLEKGIHLATTGRPGPVWLDIPMDVQAAIVDTGTMEGFSPEEKGPQPSEKHVEAVSEALACAKRPVFILGNGIRLAGGVDLLPSLLEQVPFPVITSWNGADMVPTDHPLCFGHAGVYGQRCANFVVQNSDLLIAIGSRLAIPQVGYDVAEYARGAKRIMVDIDAAELGKFSDCFDLVVEADAREFLVALLKKLANPLPSPADWIETCNRWRRDYPVLEPTIHEQKASGSINSYHFVDKLSMHLADDDIVITDMGTALTCTHQALRLRAGQRLVTSTGLGEMGYGLPGAIGAAFACPGKRIVLIVGDGSFMMNLQELQTIIHHRLPIKIFLYCNDAYLTIKHTQNSLLGGRFAASGGETGVTCPDFSEVCRAFKYRVVQLKNWTHSSNAIADTLSGLEPSLCEITMEPLQPLVPKTSVSQQPDGTLVSPPLEDLYPFLPRERLAREMIVGMHPKSAVMTLS